MTSHPGHTHTGQAHPRPWRAAALAAAAAALALLATACGSSPKPAASSSPPTYEQLLTYATCMRTHGAPTYPDPVQGPGGYWAFLNTPGSPVGDPPADAVKACQKLAPKQTGLPQSVIQAVVQQGLKLARCMRAHGITNFPDPTTSGGGVGISLGGMDQNSPQYQAAQQACRAFRPGPKGGGGQ
jgi:hypothetical protein